MNPGDKGLQPEQTMLAWRRTALSATALEAVLIKVAAEHRWSTASTIPMIFAGVVIGLIWLGARSRTGDPTGAVHKRPVRRRYLAAVTVAVIATALSATALML